MNFLTAIIDGLVRFVQRNPLTMLGALLCQMPARDAVQTAVWLHGRAGDLCAGRMGEYAMNPTDVIAALPEVTKPIIR